MQTPPFDLETKAHCLVRSITLQRVLRPAVAFLLAVPYGSALAASKQLVAARRQALGWQNLIRQGAARFFNQLLNSVLCPPHV